MSDTSSHPRSLPRTSTLVFSAFAGIGVLTFILGLGGNADRTYRVFLHNWLLWAALAQGALVLSCAFRLTHAGWQGPIQRIAESFASYIPVALLLFGGVYLGRHHLFEWTVHPVHGKEWFLREGVTFGRDTLILLWCTCVSLLYLWVSVRPTLGRAREEASGLRRTLYARWTAGWRGEAAEADLAFRRGRKLAAVVVLSYALGYSLLAVDLVMSLSPEWVSTMFPAYFAWGGFLSAISLTTLVYILQRNSPETDVGFSRLRSHDLGKMIFAFSIFWMYLFWSQYLVIWYGNVPEETGFIGARLGSQFLQDTWYMAGFWGRIAEPYVRLTLATWILLWVIPFWVLLGARPKKTTAILGSVAAGSVFGFWIERYILVTPSLVTPEDVLAGAPIHPFGLIEIGIALGFIGIFFLCYLGFSRVFPGVLPPRS
ncbi:MAG: hypothetical protein ACE5IL_04110 [Myxococcota bacterium]